MFSWVLPSSADFLTPCLGGITGTIFGIAPQLGALLHSLGLPLPI
jgi:hypothetical protein